jgi:hypothetical protein
MDTILLIYGVVGVVIFGFAWRHNRDLLDIFGWFGKLVLIPFFIVFCLLAWPFILALAIMFNADSPWEKRNSDSGKGF